MEFGITDWTALPNKLKIRVGTNPLSMSKYYVWAFHTTNHYGQGSEDGAVEIEYSGRCTYCGLTLRFTDSRPFDV